MIRVQLWHPIEEDERLRLTSFSGQEPFMIWIKAAFVTGAVIASPVVFYFLWSFVAAGLYPHEKRYVHMFLPFSLGLFLAGAALAFFFVFPPVLDFFFSFNKSLGIDPEPRISEWLSFVLLMPLGFGVSFQLPLVMLFLERIGIFDVQVYLSKWRIAVLVMAVAVDGALARRRSLQHADDAGAADVPVLRRHRAVQMDASPDADRSRDRASEYAMIGVKRPANDSATSPLLDRFAAAFAGADADAVVQRQDEDLAVADFAALAGAAAFDDGVDRGLDEFFVDGDLQLHLAEQVDGELVAAIDLGVPFLPAEALHVHHRQAKDFDLGQRRLHGFSRLGWMMAMISFMRADAPGQQATVSAQCQLSACHSVVDVRLQPRANGNARWLIVIASRPEAWRNGR